MPHAQSSLILVLALAGLAGCGERDSSPAVANDTAANAVVTAAPASVVLTAPDGAARGTIEIGEDPTGVMVRIAATGLSAGAHGVHLHAVGTCEGPKFETAGGHWNPTNRKHGRDNPDGAHGGDLANLNVGADGKGSSQWLVGGASLRGSGAMSLADADGTALVVHAKADDYKTDPSGNSGDRVACAVIASPR